LGSATGHGASLASLVRVRVRLRLRVRVRVRVLVRVRVRVRVRARVKAGGALEEHGVALPLEADPAERVRGVGALLG